MWSRTSRRRVPITRSQWAFGLRCTGRRLDDLDVLGLEHGVEGVGVLTVAVPDEETQRVHAYAQVGGEVAGLLGGPGRGRMCGDAGDMQAPGAVIENDQSVETLQADGVDVEDVAGDQAGGLRGEKLAPGSAGAAWCGVDSCGVEDPPDGGGGDRVFEPSQCALDPAMGPSAVLTARRSTRFLTTACVGGRPGPRRRRE